MQVDLVTVLCTRGGGIEEADDPVQLLVAVDTGTTFELPEDGAWESWPVWVTVMIVLSFFRGRSCTMKLQLMTCVRVRTHRKMCRWWWACVMWQTSWSLLSFSTVLPKITNRENTSGKLRKWNFFFSWRLFQSPWDVSRENCAFDLGKSLLILYPGLSFQFGAAFCTNAEMILG